MNIDIVATGLQPQSHLLVIKNWSEFGLSNELFKGFVEEKGVWKRGEYMIVKTSEGIKIYKDSQAEAVDILEVTDNQLTINIINKTSGKKTVDQVSIVRDKNRNIIEANCLHSVLIGDHKNQIIDKGVVSNNSVLREFDSKISVNRMGLINALDLSRVSTEGTVRNFLDGNPTFALEDQEVLQ